MPQLDVFAYNHQLFWFLVFMVVSYLLLSYFVLPQIFLVLYVKKNLNFLLFQGNFVYSYNFKFFGIGFTYISRLVKNLFFKLWSVWLNFYSLNFKLNKIVYLFILLFDFDLIKLQFKTSILTYDNFRLLFTARKVFVDYQVLLQNLLVLK